MKMPLCPTPIFIKSTGGLVPCRQCNQCRITRRREKTTRLVLEAKEHIDVLFVTLSYHNDFLPVDLYNPVTGELIASHPTGCLDKRALQLFNKRLRNRLPFGSYRFWAVGEYGDKKWRPHYHLVMFGLSYKDRALIHEAWSDPNTGKLFCDPARIDIQIPKKDWDVAQYCASYVMKKLTNPKDDRLDGRPPEFFLSSKGIGLGFVDKITSALQSKSGQIYIEMHQDIPRVAIIEGKRMPLDRYMRKKIIHALQVTEMATEKGQKKFAEEMQAIRVRGAQDAGIPQNRILDAKRERFAS